MSTNCDELEWSSWVPLNASLATYQASISRRPGLYRVRITGPNQLAYLGQTGRNLRERTRALAKHTFRAPTEPPWNDPHTGAPGLWAWRVEDDLEYEVSVAPLEVSYAHRQCVEDCLLFEYRLEVGESTLCNHGRFHPRWTRPTNKKGGRGMTRLPEGRDNPAGGPSLPAPSFSGQPGDSDWLTLPWSPTVPLEETKHTATEAPGVYRLMSRNEVVYLGESSALWNRLMTHAATYKGQSMTASWVAMPGALPHHLKERETDLIGGYYKQVGVPPRLQYGSK